MKRCSASLVFREMQIMSMMRYYYTPINTGKIKNIMTIPNTSEDENKTLDCLTHC